MKFEFWLPEIACWDNEGGDGGDPGAGAGDGSGGTGAGAANAGGDPGAGGAGKTFNQDDVNKIVTNRVKQLQTQLKSTEANYNKLLEQQGLSEEQRTSIENDLENVRAQLRTKEQQAAIDRKKSEEKFTNDLRKKEEEANRYKSLYETATIERAIIDASKDEGHDPDQFVQLLKGKAKLVEALDDEGKGTGNYVPKIQWEVENPDTKKYESVLKDPSEVVAMMKETPKWGNLFKSNVARGLGGGANVGASARGKVDVRNLSAGEYRELRKTPEGRRALGIEK